jgi:hypothetical protein
MKIQSLILNRRVVPIITGFLLVFGILACALAGGPGEAPVQNTAQVEVPRISVEAAKEAWDAGSAVFVDVRGDTYYQETHISGALSIPLAEIESRMDELDREAWIITYCA